MPRPRPRFRPTRVHRSRGGRGLLACLSILVLVAISFVGSGSTPASAQSSDVSAYLSKINGLRASVGAPPLQLDGTLSSLAQGWAQHLADQGSLAHAGDLSVGVSAPWSKLGENVGMGPDTGTIFNAFVNSSAHYQNLVDPSFTSVGIGVVWVGPVQYTTHRFMAGSGGGGGGGDESGDTGGSGSSSAGGNGGASTASSEGGSAQGASGSSGTSGQSDSGTPAATPPPVTPPPAKPERVGAIVAALRAIPT